MCIKENTSYTERVCFKIILGRVCFTIFLMQIPALLSSIFAFLLSNNCTPGDRSVNPLLTAILSGVSPSYRNGSKAYFGTPVNVDMNCCRIHKAVIVINNSIDENIRRQNHFTTLIDSKVTSFWAFTFALFSSNSCTTSGFCNVAAIMRDVHPSCNHRQ